MRLLNVHSQRLEEFMGRPPAYAILSHTWEDEEVLFSDITKDRSQYENKKGFLKVQYSCKQAIKDQFDYVWIDTCCIDKSSSAELSEAINSMYMWYNLAQVCYAYIRDFRAESQNHHGTHVDALRGWKWLSRGWTLQELIAPSQVLFFDVKWDYIGKRGLLREPGSDNFAGVSGAELDPWPGPCLASPLSELTNIPVTVLNRETRPCGRRQDWHTKAAQTHEPTRAGCSHCGNYYDDLRPRLDGVTISERMFWTANRKTTRVEDQAYSLLGLFGVNMPLLYGEGSQAFYRLQEEIMKVSNDQSILVMQRSGASPSLFAHHASQFALMNDGVTDNTERAQLIPIPYPGLASGGPMMSFSSKMLTLKIYLCHNLSRQSKGLFLALPNCAYRRNRLLRPALLFGLSDEAQQIYQLISAQLFWINTHNMNGVVRVEERRRIRELHYNLDNMRLRTINVMINPQSNSQPTATMTLTPYIGPLLITQIDEPCKFLGYYPFGANDVQDVEEWDGWRHIYHSPAFSEKHSPPQYRSVGGLLAFHSNAEDQPFLIQWAMQAPREAVKLSNSLWCAINNQEQMGKKPGYMRPVSPQDIPVCCLMKWSDFSTAPFSVERLGEAARTGTESVRAYEQTKLNGAGQQTCSIATSKGSYDVSFDSWWRVEQLVCEIRLNFNPGKNIMHLIQTGGGLLSFLKGGSESNQ